MFEHLDDADGVHPGSRELGQVRRRADAIRAGRRRVLTVGTCCLLLAVSIGFFLARSSTRLSSSAADYQFNLLKGPLPVGLAVPTTALVDVQFADPQSGFALAVHGGDVLLAASTDGGSTWSVRNNHLPPGFGPDEGHPGQFEFVGSTGYLWGPSGATGAPLWVSHDDGATWRQADIGPFVLDVSAIDLNAWALTASCPGGDTAGSVSCVIGMEQSLDGGTTWTSIGTFDTAVAQAGGSASQPIELARITKTRAYVLTDAADQSALPSWHLDFTDDAGGSWTPRPVPCSGAFADGAEVAASSTTDLWLLCGSQGSGGSQSKQLYRSSDGGQTWQLAAAATGVATPPTPSVPHSPLPLGGYVAPFDVGHHNLAVASTTTAWLFPSRADLYKTMDGGSSWVPVSELASAGFASGGEGNVTFLSPTQGWICEYGVGLWYTDDGVNWYPLGSS
jgi:hypothetical protein